MPAPRAYSEAPQLRPLSVPSFGPKQQFPSRLLQRHHPSLRQRTERPKQTALEANVLFVSELKKVKSTEDVRDSVKEFMQLVATVCTRISSF